MKPILFLGYDDSQTSLLNEIKLRGYSVCHTSEKTTWSDEYEMVVSFGYRHIISKEQIINSVPPIINLHVSYLPWNKGSHPNFWAHFDCTPSGVTIHEVDEGLDTGNIIYQRYVNFDPGEITFAQTHARLIYEIEALFVENIDSLFARTWISRPQRRFGNFHKSSDLPESFRGWDSVILEEITRLDHLLGVN